MYLANDKQSCLIIKLATLVLGVLFYFTYICKFYNFVILSGLLLFVFGMDNEVAFCRSWHTSLFYFRQINVLIILNILKHRQNICQVWKGANYFLSKLSFTTLVLQMLLFTHSAVQKFKTTISNMVYMKII